MKIDTPIYQIIPRAFYDRDTTTVAQELLGKQLVTDIDGILCSGIIIETESYRSDDPACHAYRGMTERNKALFGPLGHAYVYMSYGIHFCMNVVARDKSVSAGGVLLRAVYPQAGIRAMQQRRNGSKLKDLANGPGKLTQAFGITPELYGTDVTKQGKLFIAQGLTVDQADIFATPRIGISVGQDKLWRFTLAFEQ